MDRGPRPRPECSRSVYEPQEAESRLAKTLFVVVSLLKVTKNKKSRFVLTCSLPEKKGAWPPRWKKEGSSLFT